MSLAEFFFLNSKVVCISEKHLDDVFMCTTHAQRTAHSNTFLLCLYMRLLYVCMYISGAVVRSFALSVC